VLPQLLTADALDLEGNELRVLRIGQADTAHSTVLHVPSLAAVVHAISRRARSMSRLAHSEDLRSYSACPTVACWRSRIPLSRTESLGPRAAIRDHGDAQK